MRFKALAFLKSEERWRIVSLIEEEVEELINSKSTSTLSTEAEEAEPAVKQSRGQHVLLEFLKDVVQLDSDADEDDSVKEKAHTEVSK